ncbi:MAG: trigger factor [Verrucomicrobiae bacterium]|nr:trigger factor [Verrucomicrobiae bacterium]
MNVKLQDAGICRKVLEIEIPADEVQRERKGLVGEFQKFAQIPGFRVGRAPIQIIEKKFSRQIDEELQKKLIPQSYREAVAKEKLRPVSMPELSDIKLEPNSPLLFKATIEVAPDFNLPDYKAIPVKSPKISVTDKDVEDSIQLMREQYADFEEIVGRPLALGDYAVISYHGSIEGKPIAEVSPSARQLGENRNFWLLMAKDAFVPGFCEQLVGANIGEKRQLKVSFPPKFFAADLAGKEASYDVDVMGIRAKKLPELNDDFAKQLQLENVEKLKEEIRANLAKSRERQGEAERKNQLVEFLLGKVELELPESLVQSQTRRNIYDVVRENQLRGVSEDDLKNKKDEIYQHANQGARDSVKAGFILTKIAEKENLKVEPAEIEERIAEMANHNKLDPARMKQELIENGAILSLQEQLLIGKALDFLLANAKVTETDEAAAKK